MAAGHEPRVLSGFTATVHGGNALPLQVCAEHLALLGAEVRMDGRQRVADRVGDLAVRRRASGRSTPPASGVDCAIHWLAAGADRPPTHGSEIVVQALSGLMGVHGRDGQTPRRLGLEVASVAAGVVATQAVLAALIAQSRGLAAQEAETSVLQAALTFLRHHLAIATCGGRFPQMPPLPPAEAPGPPFPTADGHWVELEALSPDAWTGFWERLGAERPGAAWLPFVYRYLAGRCALPAPLRAATELHTLAELDRAAAASGVALRRLRAYGELLAEAAWRDAPWTLSPANGQRPAPADAPLGSAPLSGLRVIEVTSRLQGPLAGLLLRMLGADVLKVEPPGGDFGRGSPPMAGSLGAAYLAYNQGKRVVEIDYKRPEGRAHLVSLIAEADVFLHNWLGGRAERLSLDHGDLARHNPRLVYAHASGWGKREASAAGIAGDYLVQAHAGCGDGLNPADEPPFPSRLTLIDVMGGLLACEGILAGLYLRERSGRGCRVDTSLFAGALTLQAHVLHGMALGRETGRHHGRPLWGLLERPVATADGFLALEANGELRKVAKACGLGAAARGGPLERRIAERLRTRSAAEWEPIFTAAGIPAAAVRADLRTLPDDPRAAGLLDYADGACWVPGAPWRFHTGARGAD